MNTVRLVQMASMAALLGGSAACMAQPAAEPGSTGLALATPAVLPAEPAPAAREPLRIDPARGTALQRARMALRFGLGAHRSLTVTPRRGGVLLTFRARW